LHIEN
jgi:hypothetical protein